MMHSVVSMDTEKDTRVVFHVDVDCFYIQAEILRNKSLRGKPVAVTQFNKGGLVAMSYEAKSKGISKGDGVGEHGRAVLTRFQGRPDAAMDRVKQKCPDLLILPMDMSYYREVSRNIYDALCRWHSGEDVCQSSIDDFYLDVTDKVSSFSSSSSSSSSLFSIVGVSGTVELLHIEELDSVWQSAALLAHELSLYIKHTFDGLTVSCGVSSNRLLSRLVSPLHKPDGHTLLHPNNVQIFLSDFPISRVPYLTGKFGSEVEEAFSIRTLGELQQIRKEQLISRFSSRKGSWLYDTCRGIDLTAVKARGAPQSIISEQSFNPIQSIPALKSMLNLLTRELILRMTQATNRFNIYPTSLLLRWRIGYQSNVRSKSIPAQAELIQHFRSLAKEGNINNAYNDPLPQRTDWFDVDLNDESNASSINEPDDRVSTTSPLVDDSILTRLTSLVVDSALNHLTPLVSNVPKISRLVVGFGSFQIVSQQSGSQLGSRASGSLSKRTSSSFSSSSSTITMFLTKKAKQTPESAIDSTPTLATKSSPPILLDSTDSRFSPEPALVLPTEISHHPQLPSISQFFETRFTPESGVDSTSVAVVQSPQLVNGPLMQGSSRNGSMTKFLDFFS